MIFNTVAVSARRLNDNHFQILVVKNDITTEFNFSSMNMIDGKMLKCESSNTRIGWNEGYDGADIVEYESHNFDNDVSNDVNVHINRILPYLENDGGKTLPSQVAFVTDAVKAIYQNLIMDQSNG